MVEGHLENQGTETGNWAKSCVGRDETTVHRYLVHKHQGGLGAHCDLVYEQKGRAMGLEFHLHVTKQSQHWVLISSHQSRLFSYHFIVGGDSLAGKTSCELIPVRAFFHRHGVNHTRVFHIHRLLIVLKTRVNSCNQTSLYSGVSQCQ